MNDYNFGNFVCMLREKKGLTQADVAEQLGVTAAAVSKWENGSSKPRVEVLFKLAEILGVRPEELMAGHYIEGSELDPEAVKNINERYEYLRRIDSHNKMGVKFRRIAAFLIDWNIIGLFEMFATGILMYLFAEQMNEPEPGLVITFFLTILLYPVLFILRDVIFGRRSLGKRLLGLIVIDRQTGEVAKPSKRIFRNLFLPLMQIDVFVMLFSGSSVGDRVAGAAVITVKDLYYREDEENEVEKINSYKAPSPMSKKTILLLVCGILAAIITLIGFIFSSVSIILQSQKSTEEYQIAYEYLIESDKFAELGLTEDDLRFNSYSKNSSRNADGDKTTTAELGFRIGGGRSIYVICHDDGDGWYVCEECTKFE